MNSPLFLLEFLLFNGVALAWAGWELWSIRRSKDEPPKESASEPKSPSAEAARHPER
jgi:hypothetical protein